MLGRVEGDESKLGFVLGHDDSGGLLGLDALVLAGDLFDGDGDIEGGLRSDGLMLENPRKGRVEVQLVRHQCQIPFKYLVPIAE